MSVGVLDHFNIRTRNLAETVRFYEDVLGLEKGPRPNFAFPGAWMYSEGKPVVHLVDISLTEEQQRQGMVEYNFATRDIRPVLESGGPTEAAAMLGTDPATFLREAPGMSAFALEDGVVYHTYSAYARGLDALWGMYPWFDRAPKGRNETGLWFRRHDEYPAS